MHVKLGLTSISAFKFQLEYIICLPVVGIACKFDPCELYLALPENFVPVLSSGELDRVSSCLCSKLSLLSLPSFKKWISENVNYRIQGIRHTTYN